MSDTPTSDNVPSDDDAAPSTRSVRDYLLYSLSLPERTLRLTAGLAGGVVRESANLLVPQAFRNSKSYSILVQQSLDFLTDDVAGIKRPVAEGEEPKVESFIAKKTVGSFVEMASLATLHVSPILVLAVVSDVAYGSKAYLKELADELKREGVIAQDSTIDRASDLLEAIHETSSVGATVFDTPPLSVEGLRTAIEQTTQSISKIDPTQVLPASEIDRLWREMHDVAQQENVSMLEVSGAMTLHAVGRIAKVGQGALSTVRCAGSLVDRVVLDHYRVALGDLHTRGYYQTLAETSRPYIAAVWDNFSSDRSTITEDLLSGKLVGQAATTVSKWLGWSTSPATDDPSTAAVLPSDDPPAADPPTERPAPDNDQPPS